MSTAVVLGGVRFRAARARDLDVLPDIELRAQALFRPYGWARQLSRHSVDPAAFRAAQRAGRLRIAADASDVAIGFAMTTRLESWAQLAEVDVVPEWGRRGIGSELVRWSVRWAEEHGFEQMVLSTMRDVPWNAPFYRRFGFREVSPEDLPAVLRRLRAEEARWGLPVSDRVVMTRTLRRTS